MPLNVPLSTLRLELRAETGTSLNPAQGVQVQQTIDLLLARQQRELWDAYNWEHLQYWSDMPVAQGQALYSYPVEMPFEQIRRIFISMAPTGQWTPLRYGIKPWMIRPAGPNQGTPVRRHRRDGFHASLIHFRRLRRTIQFRQRFSVPIQAFGIVRPAIGIFFERDGRGGKIR